MVAFRASLDGAAAFCEVEQVALDQGGVVAEFDGVDGVEAVVEGSVLGCEYQRCWGPLIVCLGATGWWRGSSRWGPAVAWLGAAGF